MLDFAPQLAPLMNVPTAAWLAASVSVLTTGFVLFDLRKVKSSRKRGSAMLFTGGLGLAGGGFLFTVLGFVPTDASPQHVVVEELERVYDFELQEDEADQLIRDLAYDMDGMSSKDEPEEVALEAFAHPERLFTPDSNRSGPPVEGSSGDRIRMYVVGDQSDAAYLMYSKVTGQWTLTDPNGVEFERAGS